MTRTSREQGENKASESEKNNGRIRWGKVRTETHYRRGVCCTQFLPNPKSHHANFKMPMQRHHRLISFDHWHWIDSFRCSHSHSKFSKGSRTYTHDLVHIHEDEGLRSSSSYLTLPWEQTSLDQWSRDMSSHARFLKE